MEITRTGFTNTGTALHALSPTGRALCGRFVVTIIRRTDVIVTCRQCRAAMRRKA